MRVIVVGATGTIGQAVADALAAKHEVVRVGHSSGDQRVDITSQDSIKALFQALAPFDAVVSVAGQAVFKPLGDLEDADFGVGLSNKLMGQVNLALLAVPHLNDNGSITLTSGVLAQQPMPGSAAISPFNAAVEAFARAAALELPRGMRINVVSPPWVKETLAAMGMDPTPGMAAADVARSYVEAVEGSVTGQTLDARVYA